MNYEELLLYRKEELNKENVKTLLTDLKAKNASLKEKIFNYVEANKDLGITEDDVYSELQHGNKYLFSFFRKNSLRQNVTEKVFLSILD